MSAPAPATPELDEKDKAELAELELKLRLAHIPKQRYVYGETELGYWDWMWV